MLVHDTFMEETPEYNMLLCSYRLFVAVRIYSMIVNGKEILKNVVTYSCRCSLKWDFVMLLIHDTLKRHGHGTLTYYNIHYLL